MGIDEATLGESVLSVREVGCTADRPYREIAETSRSMSLSTRCCLSCPTEADLRGLFRAAKRSHATASYR